MVNLHDSATPRLELASCQRATLRRRELRPGCLSDGVEVTAVSVDFYPIRRCITGDLVVVQDEKRVPAYGHRAGQGCRFSATCVG